MKTYLQQLFEQIEKLNLSDSASIVLTALEGEPAILQVREGPTLHIYKQNEDLTELVQIQAIDL